MSYNLDDDIKEMAKASGNLPENADDNKTLAELEAETEERELRKEAEETVVADENYDEDVELSLRTIIGGDFLRSRIFISQVGYMMYIVLLIVIYTWNRYEYQDDILLEDALRKELKDVKYNVLTQSSELMNYLRQSNVEQVIKQMKESLTEEDEESSNISMYKDLYMDKAISEIASQLVDQIGGDVTDDFVDQIMRNYGITGTSNAPADNKGLDNAQVSDAIAETNASTVTEVLA